MLEGLNLEVDPDDAIYGAERELWRRSLDIEPGASEGRAMGFLNREWTSKSKMRSKSLLILAGSGNLRKGSDLTGR